MRTHAMCLVAALVMCVAGCVSTGPGTEPKEAVVRGTAELAKWIPAESVVTVTYDGDNAAARKTALHDLFEDPQMKAVFDGPLAALKKLAVEEAKKKGGPDLDALLPLLNAQIAFAFVGLAPPADQNQPPQPELLFVVKVGEPDSPAAKAAALLVDSMARDMQLPPDAFKPAKIAGVDAKVAIKVGIMAPSITVGYATTGGYFIFGGGNALAKSLNPEVPKLADSADFRRVSQVTGGNEVILIHYAHTAFMQKFAAGIPRELTKLLVNPEFGLANVKSVSLALAPMDRGFRLSLFIHAPGEKRGILKIIAAKPLGPDIIRLAPKNSDFFCARSIDPAALWDFVVAQAAAEPDAKADYDEKMAEAVRKLGFDLRKDFVASLGDEFAMFGPPFVVAVKLRDQAKFTACVDKALAKIAEEVRKGGEPEMQGAQLKLSTMTYEGRAITYVDGKHFPLFIQPCYTMAGDYAVFAFNPVGLKSYILAMHGRLAVMKAAPKPSLAENDDFKALRAKLGPEPSGIYYARSVGFYRQVYDWMPMMAGMMKMAPKEAQAVVPDSAMLPPFEDISKYFFSSVAAVRAVDDGILMESYSPFGLPAPPEIGMGGGLATTSILAGMFLPALGRAREAARNVKDMNNLKQIGVAAVMWMTAKGDDQYFPPSLKSLLDDGMLSDPRVLISPSSTTSFKPGEFVTDYECIFDMVKTKVSERDAIGMPIAWDKEPFYNGGRNVVFSDSHVAFLDEASFQRLMEQKVKPWVEKMNQKEGEEEPAAPPADKAVPDTEKPADKGLDNF